jgi:hypothetical protein
MNNLDKDTLINIIAALGAQAHKVPGLEQDNRNYYRWWQEEQDAARKLRTEVKDLQSQIADLTSQVV